MTKLLYQRILVVLLALIVVFGGWFADKALTKPWDTQHDAVQSSMTLYARWL